MESCPLNKDAISEMIKELKLVEAKQQEQGMDTSDIESLITSISDGNVKINERPDGKMWLRNPATGRLERIYLGETPSKRAKKGGLKRRRKLKGGGLPDKVLKGISHIITVGLIAGGGVGAASLTLCKIAPAIEAYFVSQHILPDLCRGQGVWSYVPLGTAFQHAARDAMSLVSSSIETCSQIEERYNRITEQIVAAYKAAALANQAAFAGASLGWLSGFTAFFKYAGPGVKLYNFVQGKIYALLQGIDDVTTKAVQSVMQKLKPKRAASGDNDVKVDIPVDEAAELNREIDEAINEAIKEIFAKLKEEAAPAASAEAAEQGAASAEPGASAEQGAASASASAESASGGRRRRSNKQRMTARKRKTRRRKLSRRRKVSRTRK